MHIDWRKDLTSFRLYLDTDNDAFQPTPCNEIARILRKIADKLETVDDTGRYAAAGGWIGHYQTIFDANGNDVGRYALKPADDVLRMPFSKE